MPAAHIVDHDPAVMLIVKDETMGYVTKVFHVI